MNPDHEMLRLDMVWADLTQLCALRWPPRELDKPWFIGALLAPIGVWALLWASSPTQTIRWTSGAALFLLSVILWQPVIEELCFRGILQGLLLRQTQQRIIAGPLTQANLITSCVFALAHLFTHPWLWAVGIFFVSLVFGYARERSASLYPSIELHGYYNTGYFLLAGF